jgi:hypothetical protein
MIDPASDSDTPMQTDAGFCAFVSPGCIDLYFFLALLHNGFVNWADNVYHTEPAREEFTPRRYPRYSFIREGPIKPLSFAFAWRTVFFPPGSQGSPVSLLCISSMLFVFCFFLLRRDAFLAWCVAVLFAIHPLRVESSHG